MKSSTNIRTTSPRFRAAEKMPSPRVVQRRMREFDIKLDQVMRQAEEVLAKLNSVDRKARD